MSRVDDTTMIFESMPQRLGMQRPAILLFRALIGSRLYGTMRPDSDFDYLDVVLPSGRDILLGRGIVSRHDAEAVQDDGSTADVHTHTLGRFLMLLRHGDGFAVEALFSPPELSPLPRHPAAEAIMHRARQVISPTAQGMLEFAESQLRRTATSDRYHILQRMIRVLDAHPGPTVATAAPSLVGLAEDHPDTVSVREIPDAKGGTLSHLVLFGRAYAYTLRQPDFKRSLDTLAARYGQRVTSIQVGAQDMRFLGHALRLAEQATELARTHRLIFPRPRLDTILRIRHSQVSVEEARAEVMAALAEAKTCVAGREEVSITDVEDLMGHMHQEMLSGQW